MAGEKVDNPFEIREEEEQEPILDNALEVSLQPDEEEPDGPSRQEKKRNRFQEQIEAREAAERRLEEIQRQHEQLQRDYQAAMQINQIATKANAKPESNESDEYQKQLDEIWKQRLTLHDNFAARAQSMTPEQRQQFLDETRNLESKYVELQVKKNMASAQPKGQQQPPVDENRIRAIARWGDVLEHPKAYAWAQSEVLKRQAMGVDVTPEVWDEAADAARKQFRMGRYRARDNSAGQKAKYMAAGGAAGGPTEPQSIRMTPEMRKIAEARYDNLSPEEAYRKWAQEVGRDLVSRKT